MAVRVRGWLRGCWHNQLDRGLTTSSFNPSEALLKEFSPARRAPEMVPFQLTPEQAKEEFLRWQRRQVYLAPGDLLSQGTYQLRAGMLPFWLFSVRARVEYRGLVGKADGGGVDWRPVGWKVTGPPQEYPWTDPAMQVYASYKYRRDFAEVAKAGGRLAQMLGPLPREAASRGVVAGPPPQAASDGWGGEVQTPLDPPTMRQAIAWEFALRAIHQNEARAAEERLRSEHGASHVRDIHVRVTPLGRSVRLAYGPAYVLDYIHGETFNVHGERKAEEFQAMVSVRGVVAGERHISAHKVSLVAGTAAVGLMGASSVLAPLMGMDPWSLVGLESGFYAVATAYTAGLSARLLPLLMKQRDEHARVRAEEEEFERVVSMGLGPQDPGSPEQEVLRSNAEWRRWEESDKAGWREHKRARWAEELWRGQHKRRLERIRVVQRLRQEAERQEANEERERRRQERWGNSSQRHHFGGRQNMFAGGHRAGGRRDFLGYYHLLGLDGRPQGSVSQDDIKRAFRRAALEWHPDKHEGQHADASAKRHARQRFNEIRAAYEVLRDPERRREYDMGRLVKP